MKLKTNANSEMLKSVKANCDKAPFGEKRAAAMKHYHAAEAAHKAKNDAKTFKELEAANYALV